ncbi:MAG: hypothetical protein QOE80_3342 [Actinomycetota bacterium]|nr:hypothetical protein [Actinomycetota bacterium]
MNQLRRLAGLAAAGVILGSVLAPPVAGSEPAAGHDAGSTNVNMVGEAFTVRQDGTVPTELLLARYPRAATEVSDDLSTGFASFADPGFLGRFGIGGGFAASGKRELTAPTWAECLYPQSPQTPTAETRAPGGGLGPTAVAECRGRGSHLAGYATQAAPDGAQAAHLRGGPLTATVDTVAGPDGATDVVSASEINDVTLGGVVTLRSVRNRAVATTTGRPGGAKAVAEATIGALLVNGNPVALPSDSIARLGPVLAALGPVLSPVGTFTFDVVPELVEAASDGTQATARAAQITVTLHTGQLTASFGLGYARAGARTIVNEPLSGDGNGSGLGDRLGDLTPPSSSESAPPPSGAAPAWGRSSGDGSAPGPASGDNPTAGSASGGAASLGGPGTANGLGGSGIVTGPAFSAAPLPSASPLTVPSGGPAPTSGAETAAPRLPAAAPATAVSTGPRGPSRRTVALLGVICAAVLVRYLSYSTKLRRL